MTSAYGSYSGCRQYRENLAAAVDVVGERAPQLDRIRHYFNHPGFVEPMVDATLTALAELGDAARRDAHILFVTHSIPEAILLADRVVVMSPRPGRVARVLRVDLPRPRTMELEFDPRFKAHSDEIRSLIFAGRKERP